MLYVKGPRYLRVGTFRWRLAVYLRGRRVSMSGRSGPPPPLLSPKFPSDARNLPPRSRVERFEEADGGGTQVDEIDASGFDAAFDDLRRIASRTAFRLLGSRADAEDIAAETLARACARWRSVSDHAEPWVVTTATHLVFDLLRRRRTANSQRHRLGELPTRQREVVALRILADYTEADTERAMGVDVGTVKSQTSRALARLRHLMVLEGGGQDA